MFSLLVACCVCDVRLKIDETRSYVLMDDAKFENIYMFNNDEDQIVTLKEFAICVNDNMDIMDYIPIILSNIQTCISGSYSSTYMFLYRAMYNEFTNSINVYNSIYSYEPLKMHNIYTQMEKPYKHKENNDYIINEVSSWVDTFNKLMICNFYNDSECPSSTNNTDKDTPSEPEVNELDLLSQRVDNLNESLIELHDNYIHSIETFYKFVDNTNKMFNTLNTTFSEQIEELSKQEDKPSETPIVEQIIQPIEITKNNYTWCIILTVFLCLLYVEQIVVFILMKFCRERIEQFVGANNDVLTDEEKQIYHMK